jgi:hypothetical protein
MTAIPQPRCPYCSATYHAGTACPRVSAFEYYEAGQVIKRVEFHALDDDGLRTLLLIIEARVKAIEELMAK